VFSAQTNDVGDLVLRCLGLILPGDTHHRVATFDKIRAAIADLACTPGSALRLEH
jgi:hypothetical protein